MTIIFAPVLPAAFTTSIRSLLLPEWEIANTTLSGPKRAAVVSCKCGSECMTQLIPARMNLWYASMAMGAEPPTA
ncbi:hypothetical protein D3C75_1177820 [compost metagenome]